MGCPISWQMKFVMSTMLLIGVSPMLSNLFFNHAGDSAMVTPEIVTPEYLGHASALSTITGIVRSRLSTENLSTDGHLISRFFEALISRATPMWEVASARFGVNPISIL